jgi:hypothetical protein
VTEFGKRAFKEMSKFDEVIRLVPNPIWQIAFLTFA